MASHLIPMHDLYFQDSFKISILPVSYLPLDLKLPPFSSLKKPSYYSVVFKSPI